MKQKCTIFSIVFLLATAQAQEGVVPSANKISVSDGWVTVTPPEFQGAINNPLKGYRDYLKDGYGLLKRQYVRWNEIEVCAGDSVERIIAHTNKITNIKGKRFEELNVKLVPRVFLDWNDELGPGKDPKQHWPADLHTFDYDSPAFQKRLKALIAKLGQAWDNDPRIFAVQMGLIGHYGEHHTPAPTADQRRLLTEAFQNAFKNKPVLARHTDPEFMQAGFGIYYDTFAYIDREPPEGSKDQFPWQATHVYPNIWKRAPIEGEVEYNWQAQRDNAKPKETFGRTPDDTMKVPAYRRYMIDKIRRYHASYLGWIDNYDDSNSDVVAGAAELQKAFGYRFVLDSVSYPKMAKPDSELNVKFAVRNTGSAPFYLDWPIAVALLDPETKKPVWSAPLSGVDIRKWLPGEDWDSATFAYRRAAKQYLTSGTATLPGGIKAGRYILALAILDRQGGMVPSARFATENYFRGGWHPFGYIGIGKAPQDVALTNIAFDSPAFDNSLSYKVPETLRSVQTPPVPAVKAVTPWTPDPKQELINPWRYWTLDEATKSVEKQIRNDGPAKGPAGGKVIRVIGDFGDRSRLDYTFGKDYKLNKGRYKFTCRVRGTPGLSAEFEVGDGWHGISKETPIPLTFEWREHVVDLEIKVSFKDEPTLRFKLPKNAQGQFDLTDTHLREAD